MCLAGLGFLASSVVLSVFIYLDVYLTKITPGIWFGQLSSDLKSIERGERVRGEGDIFRPAVSSPDLAHPGS
jgi:hypothetical protein